MICHFLNNLLLLIKLKCKIKQNEFKTQHPKQKKLSDTHYFNDVTIQHRVFKRINQALGIFCAQKNKLDGDLHLTHRNDNIL